MRLISQGGMIDVPYDLSIIEYEACERNGEDVFHIIFARTTRNTFSMARYSTEAKALKVMEMVRNFKETKEISNVPLSNLFLELFGAKCQEDYKLLYGSKGEILMADLIKIKDYFQFPKDEEVEV